MSDNVRFVKAWTHEGVTNGEWMDLPGGKHTHVLTTRQWHEDTEQELESLRAELDERDKEAESLALSNVELVDINLELKGQIERCTAHTGSLEVDLAAKDKRIEELSHEVERLENQLVEVRDKQFRAEGVRDQLRTELAEANKRIKRLNGDLDIWARAVREYKDQYNEVMRK